MGSCEHGIKLQDSIKVGEFLDELSDYKLFKIYSVLQNQLIINKLSESVNDEVNNPLIEYSVSELLTCD